MADCTYCGKGYEPYPDNPMGRCGDCGRGLVYERYDIDANIKVDGTADGDWLSVVVRGRIAEFDRLGAMRLRDELDHWLASTVDYETTASTEGEVVSTGRPRDLEAVR